jgi:hypothetical protein
MKIPGVTGLNDSEAPNFVGASLQGKIVQFMSDVTSRFMKTIQSLTQDPPRLFTSSLPLELWFNIFCSLNAEELARIAPVCKEWNALASSDAVSYKIPFPSWLKNINADIWRKLDLEKYGLDISDVPRVNRRTLTKALKPLSRRVEKRMGITNMVIPKGLTLNIVLRIAKDNSVPIKEIWPEALTTFGDIAVEQTRVLFFTNSIFEGTRTHFPESCKGIVEVIGRECGIAIQEHEIRNFMAFLVLTYLNSPEDDRVRLYASNAYTRMIEKVNYWFLTVGFPSTGLVVKNKTILGGEFVGVGASGSSENILYR